MKTALVTNCTDFAGPGTISGLVAAGWRVLAHDRSFTGEGAWAAFSDEFPGLERIEAIEPGAVVVEAFERTERLDAIVSNYHWPARLMTTEVRAVSDLRENLEHLVVAPFALMGAAIPLFKKQKSGNVVMITSNRNRLPQKGGAIPDAARAAQNALVRSLAIELADYGITLNAVAPNFLYSEAYYPKAIFEETQAGRDYVARSVPVGRLGERSELGELIEFLCGAQSRFMTGSIIDWSGGWPVGEPRPS